VVQPEDHPHRRGLASPVGAEKTGDDARLDRTGEIVDGASAAEDLRQSA
jgi:hypothetical protein